jgi:phospholipid/cholesterol/gamma-HCH transport system substrate-binding protein
MKNTLETRLGIFFALALVVAVIILEMIGAADFFKSGYQVNASFKNAQELKKGDLVKMAGVEIGRVESIDLVEQRAKVVMKIKGKYEIKTDAKAAIKFTGLMGQNFVSIEDGTLNAANALAGATLETFEQPDLSAIMTKLDSVASGVEGLTKSFSPENFSSLLGPITDFMKQNTNNLGAILSNTRLVTEQIAQGKGTVGKLIYDDSLYNNALSTVTSLQLAAGEAKSLISDAHGAIGVARNLIDQVNAGQGTLGMLAKDPALYKETTATMTNAREILEKINHGQGSVGKLINDESFLKNAKLSLQKLDKATEGLEDQGPLSVLGILINNLF